MKMQYLLLVLFFSSATIMAQPPEPPPGKRWVLNEAFSDEFNGTELDTTKWLNYHPTWKGRPPGLFLPSQVSVKDGYLQLKGGKMAKDSIIYNSAGEPMVFNVASGIVISKANDAYFGYYECRFKAAKTTMSSTFWLSTSTVSEGPEPCKDKYGLELDIQECIGREGEFDGKWFAKGMHSNGHFWYTDCEGKRHDYRSPEVRFPSDALESAAFNTYGGWWRDESGASFYYNRGEPKDMHFYDKVKSKPFDMPMTMRLASETYPTPWISLPTDEELADSTKNVCYYDWVRSYYLVDVAEPLKKGNRKNMGLLPESPDWPMFQEKVTFIKTTGPAQIGHELALNYMASKDRELCLVVSNEQGESIEEQILPVYAGYGQMAVTIRQPLAHGVYTAKVSIRPKGAKNNDRAYHHDSIAIEKTKGAL
ncbi:beta-glucanase (GH16 family) [Dyadobacter jejuensis]|uniref:Beta-glucanase (GH16 family) n=1 Tax=Dyadobacter jejuensis TaxID=1082580 RepID=A0A316ALA4_9BACT|nr:family 16 glycosylhydrolase [Dyadobacter jejuensis]PWJ58039.1 beta-glucanase (GH16 family) [Dyadobacter jejuensis]